MDNKRMSPVAWSSRSSEKPRPSGRGGKEVAPAGPQRSHPGAWKPRPSGRGGRPPKDNSTRRGASASRFSCHVVKVPCGSVSIRKTSTSPARWACTDRCAHSVVLPDPPFCEFTTIVCIKTCSYAYIDLCEHSNMKQYKHARKWALVLRKRLKNN